MIRKGRDFCAFLWIALLLLGVIGCGRTETPCDDAVTLDVRDIVSAPVQTSLPLGVDICIDATPSMDGFVVPPNSAYKEFLDDLEASSGIDVRDRRFFKFGEDIREVPRAEFRNAKTRAFYHQPGIFKDTNLELVFNTRQVGDAAQTSDSNSESAGKPTRRVIAVVTDLFQRDQDVNAVVAQIREHCLSDPTCSVGLLAIVSQFDGTVYDARVPSFPYRSTEEASTFRPFYLLMFGQEDDLRRFVDVLSSRTYVDARRFALVGARTVSGFTAALARPQKQDGVTRREACGALDFSVNLRRGFAQAPLKATVEIKPDPRTYPFNPSRVALRTFRESQGKRTPADSEVTLETRAKGTVLEIDALVRPPSMRGDYTYVFEVLTGEINGFELPSWIAELTSPDPRPDRDPAKTLNLDRFVQQLIATSIAESSHQPKLARFRVLIHRL